MSRIDISISSKSTIINIDFLTIKCCTNCCCNRTAIEYISGTVNSKYPTIQCQFAVILYQYVSRYHAGPIGNRDGTSRLGLIRLLSRMTIYKSILPHH